MTTQYDDTNLTVPVIAGVRFYEIGKLYHFDCGHVDQIRIGDYVVVETTRGRQLGQIMNVLTEEAMDPTRDYKPILRKATPTDMMSQKLWKAREDEALATCQQKADELGSFDNVKFVAAQYNFDGSLLTFLFSAEDKISTGKLRSALQRSFKAKVELRQIGPRDVAKLIGGMGACGIQTCCSRFLTDFSPISIKMAKAQGISLNPSEITGMCGRLRCCLIYEYEQYVEARKSLPKRNKQVGTPHGEGRVIDVHPLQDGVTVMIDDQRVFVEREEIIPLDEYHALQAKAQAGCSKSENGECDCGQHEGASQAATSPGTADAGAAAEVGGEDDHPAEPHAGSADESDKQASESSRRTRSRRRRKPRSDQDGGKDGGRESKTRGRNRPRRGKRPRNRSNPPTNRENDSGHE